LVIALALPFSKVVVGELVCCHTCIHLPHSQTTNMAMRLLHL